MTTTKHRHKTITDIAVTDKHGPISNKGWLLLWKQKIFWSEIASMNLPVNRYITGRCYHVKNIWTRQNSKQHHSTRQSTRTMKSAAMIQSKRTF